MVKSGPSLSSTHFASLPYENTHGPIDLDAESTDEETGGLQATQMSAFDGFESPPHKLAKKLHFQQTASSSARPPLSLSLG